MDWSQTQLNCLYTLLWSISFFLCVSLLKSLSMGYYWLLQVLMSYLEGLQRRHKWVSRYSHVCHSGALTQLCLPYFTPIRYHAFVGYVWCRYVWCRYVWCSPEIVTNWIYCALIQLWVASGDQTPISTVFMMGNPALIRSSLKDCSVYGPQEDRPFPCILLCQAQMSLHLYQPVGSRYYKLSLVS